MGGDLEGVRSEVEGAMKSIAAGAASILAPFAAFGRRLISQGLETAGFFEKTEAQMGVMVGSVAKAKELISDLVAFGTKTPFQIPELMQSAQQLTSVGIEIERVIPTLKMLGDAAMGDREKFGRLMYVFKEVQSKGKLMGNDFMQISSTGAISAKFLAEAFKITETKAAGMMRNLSAADLTKYFQIVTGEGGRFANMMGVMSGTLEGLKSNFQDSIIYIKKYIGEPLVPYLKSTYIAMTEVVMATANFIKTGGEATSFAFVGATAFAGLGAGLFAAAFGAKLLGISLRGFLIGTGIGIFIVALGALVGYLTSVMDIPKKIGEGWEYLKKVMSGHSEILTNLKIAWENIKIAAELTWTAIVQAAAPVVSYLGAAWKSIYDYISGILSKLLLKVSEFALDASEWILAISHHWSALWKKFPAAVAVATAINIDIFRNAFAMMLDIAKRGVAAIIRVYYKMATEIGIFMEKERSWRIGNGPLPKAQIQAMREAGKKEADNQIKGLGLKESGVKSIFQQSDLTKELIRMSGLGKVFSDIFKTKKELEKDRKLPGGMGEKTATPKSAGPKSPSDSEATPLLVKAGMYGIEEFGKTLQKGLLDDKKNPANITNDLLRDSMELQKKQLKAAEETEKKIGAGMGE